MNTRKSNPQNTFTGAGITILAIVVGFGVWSGGRGNGVVGSAAAGVLSAPAPVSPAAPPPELHRDPAATRAVDAQIRLWDKKTQAKPTDGAAWTNLADALMQKGRETADVDYFNRAETLYRKALTLTPGKAAPLDGLAWVTAERHQFEECQGWAHKALAINEKDNFAYGLLGDADVEMGRYDDAFADYQKMLDNRPDLSSYSRGAHLLFLTGDLKKALWLMNKAMTSGAPYAENTAWCRAQISTMLFADGAYLPAKQVAEDAYKTAPNNYHVLIALAKVRAAYKDYKGAIDAYEKAVAIAPQHEALVALGDLYEVTGRKADAQKQYDLVEAVYNMNKAMGMKGDWAMALFYANHDRNLPEALQMVQEEYKTRPNAAVADSLAWCLYKNGQFTEAKKYAQVALAHGVLDSGYLYHAGMIDLKCNDTTAGQKLLDDCLSLSSQFHPIYARDAEKALREIGAPPRTVAQTTTEKP